MSDGGPIELFPERPTSALLFAGYFPKRVTHPPEWMADLGILEVGSVSLCISSGPDDWTQAWKHNAWGFYDTPELAWSVVPEGERASYRLYAYRARATDVAAPGVAEDVAGDRALADGFESIGFDVVSRSTGMFFECSPLSCNLLAQEIVTNPYCLIETRDQAEALAARIESMGVEPGPYFVLEVLREP